MKKASDALTPTGARLSEVLDSRSGTTARVLARAARLQALSAELQKLDAPWAPALRVANLRGDCVVVFTHLGEFALFAFEFRSKFGSSRL